MEAVFSRASFTAPENSARTIFDMSQSLQDIADRLKKVRGKDNFRVSSAQKGKSFLFFFGGSDSVAELLKTEADALTRQLPPMVKYNGSSPHTKFVSGKSGVVHTWSITESKPAYPVGTTTAHS